MIEGLDGRWWMFYTQRRAGDTALDVTWVHGTDIVTACSADDGLTWTYVVQPAGGHTGPGRLLSSVRGVGAGRPAPQPRSRFISGSTSGSAVTVALMRVPKYSISTASPSDTEAGR